MDRNLSNAVWTLMAIMLVVFVVLSILQLLAVGTKVRAALFGPMPTVEPVGATPGRNQSLLARISPGDSPETVAQQYADAWYKADCRYPDETGRELYFFDGTSPSKSVMIVVFYLKEDEDIIVHNHGTMEYYQLNLYDDCVPEHFLTPQP